MVGNDSDIEISSLSDTEDKSIGEKINEYNSRIADDDDINLQQLSARVPESFYNTISHYANKYGVSMSALVRFMLYESLEKFNKENDDVPKDLERASRYQKTNTHASTKRGIGTTVKQLKGKFEDLRADCIYFYEEGFFNTSVKMLEEIFDLLFKCKNENEFICEDLIDVWCQNDYDALKETDVWNEAVSNLTNEQISELSEEMEL